MLVHNADCHAHHIVMKGEMSGWTRPGSRQALEDSRALLKKHDIPLNDPKNIVNTLNEGHSIKYTQEVNRRLQEAANEATKQGLDVKNAILKELDDIAGEIGGSTPKAILPQM